MIIYIHAGRVVHILIVKLSIITHASTSIFIVVAALYSNTHIYTFSAYVCIILIVVVVVV